MIRNISELIEAAKAKAEERENPSFVRIAMLGAGSVFVRL